MRQWGICQWGGRGVSLPFKLLSINNCGMNSGELHNKKNSTLGANHLLIRVINNYAFSIELKVNYIYRETSVLLEVQVEKL